MNKPKNDEPVVEVDAPVSHEEMVRRLKADPLCTYHEFEGDGHGEGMTIVGGINHEWASKHMKAQEKAIATAKDAERSRRSKSRA